MRYCLLALVLCSVMAGGCLMENMAPQRRFKDAVQRVNDGMRWSRTDVAIPHVEEGYRAKFIRARNEWGGVINIADTEILRAQLSDETPDEATSVVAVRWYSKAHMRLFETRIQQSWKHGARGKGYQLVDEEVVGGNPELLAEAGQTAGGESTASDGDEPDESDGSEGEPSKGAKSPDGGGG